MKEFMGSHPTRIDAKGRVLIPASFRGLLKNENGVASVIARPSDKHACIECWPEQEFAELAEELKPLSRLGDDREDVAAALYADAVPLESDREGRIVLPGSLTAHAGLTDTMVFMGIGRIFQIWAPEAAERRRAEARTRLAALRNTLGAARA